LIIYGGKNVNKKNQGTLLYYDFVTKEYEEITTKINLSGHSSNLNDKEIIIFGGMIGEGYSLSNDVYKIEIEEKTIKLVECYGEKPMKRKEHSSNIYNDSLFVIGGFDGTIIKIKKG
jgi:preprotein translocase subunit YajC